MSSKSSSSVAGKLPPPPPPQPSIHRMLDAIGTLGDEDLSSRVFNFDVDYHIFAGLVAAFNKANGGVVTIPINAAVPLAKAAADPNALYAILIREELTNPVYLDEGTLKNALNKPNRGSVYPDILSAFALCPIAIKSVIIKHAIVLRLFSQSVETRKKLKSVASAASTAVATTTTTTITKVGDSEAKKSDSKPQPTQKKVAVVVEDDGDDQMDQSEEVTRPGGGGRDKEEKEKDEVAEPTSSPPIISKTPKLPDSPKGSNEEPIQLYDGNEFMDD